MKNYVKLGCALCAAILAGCAPAGAPERVTVSPTYEAIASSITTTGVVTPRNRLEIRPPVAGRLETMAVKEGQAVKTGDVLATMSSTDRATLLDAARGRNEWKYWQEVYRPIELVAPLDATVIVATLQPGQVLATTDPVVVLSDQLIVRAQVDETDIGKVKLNQEAVVTLDSFPDQPIQATVEHIYYESVVESNVTVYKVDLRPTSVPEFFRSGMNAQVAFQLAQKDKALVLPLDAVQMNGKTATVRVLNAKDEEEKREVEVGIVAGDRVEIVSGLTPADKVVRKARKTNVAAPTSGGNPLVPQFGRPRAPR